MKREPKILSESDYDELALEMVEIQRTDALLGDYRIPYIRTNRKFYPLLIDALKRLKATEKVADSVISPIIEELESRNDYVETGLPDWVINDRAVDHYLTDHLSIHKAGEFQKFQNWVVEKSEELSGGESFEFIKWCIAKLETNYRLHKRKCTRPLDCDVNKSYERRIAFVQSLMEQEKFNALPVLQNNQKELVKIQWLGTQRQLAELFIVLKKKGWIERFEYDTIKSCFTDSDSIQQYLKPGKDERGEPTYPEVFKPGFDERFYGIKKNEPK